MNWTQNNGSKGGWWSHSANSTSSGSSVLTDADASYILGASGGDPDDDGFSVDYGNQFSAYLQSSNGVENAISPVLYNTTAAGSAGSSGSSTDNLVSGGGGAGSFVINITYDQAQSSLPAGFVSAIDYVVSYYESIFTAPVTVNIDVGYGEIDGQSLGSSGILGESETYVDPESYSAVVSALEANATTSQQAAAYTTLPATSPFGSDTLWMATAEEKALGLISESSDLDGYVGFSSYYPWSYSPTATPASGEYYFVGVVEHEISEVMGRDSFLGEGIGGTTSYSLMDMFRYSAPGERDTTATPPVRNTAYFSINNGDTEIDSWNTDQSGDLGDWSTSAPADAYLAFSPADQINGVTSADLELMNVIGWNESTAVTGIQTVSSGSTGIISSGQTSGGIDVLSGGILEVLSGGTAISATVFSGGQEFVSAGGTDSAAIISGGEQLDFGYASGVDVFGGSQVVESGAIAVSTVLASNGDQVVYGTANATVLSGSFAIETVEAGGIASGPTIGSGSYLLDGGTASAVVVASGGQDYVTNGGSESGTTVSSGGLDYVEAGGRDAGATVSGGGNQIVYGIASGTTVLGGGYEVIYGTADTTVLSGTNAIESVGVGGIASGTTVGSAAYLLDGGTASGALVESGGQDYVTAGGSQSRATVAAGGLDYVEAGGSDSGATISGNADQVVYGTAKSTLLSGIFAIESIEAGGVASGTTIGSGGYILDAGTASGALVASGGQDYVLSGGSEIGTNVSSGGLDYIETGGSDTGATIFGNADQVIYGAAKGTVLSGSFAIESVEVGGVASGTTVGSGSYLLDAGTASGAQVRNGGQDYVLNGGSEIGTNVSSGGLDYIETGGSDIGATIAGNADQIVYGSAKGTVLSGIFAIESIEAAGVASGTTVGSGSYLLNAGTAFGALVESGGQDYVTSGGTEFSATVFSGGLDYIESGGTLSAVTISSGTVDIVGGATFSGTVTFVNSGLLELGSSQAFAGLVAGFSGTAVAMDLQDISWVGSGSAGATTVSWTQITSGASASGTLMVSGGGHSADITLLGQYVTANFAISSDGNGGTFVVDPPIASDSAAALVNTHH